MIYTIFKKELKETLRDKRTLISMVLMPLFLFPLLFGGIFEVQKLLTDRANNKTVKIGVVNADGAQSYIHDLENIGSKMGKIKISSVANANDLKKSIESDSIQIGVVFPSNFNQLSDAKKTANIDILYKEFELGILDKAKVFSNLIFEKEQQKRFIETKTDPQIFTPFQYSYVNVSSEQETIGNLVGGFLPYILIVFGFVGCMYPCIDLFTGEKERGTFETLLTTPVTRWQIMLGKMGVVVFSGFMSVVFNILGILMALQIFGSSMDPGLIKAISDMLNITTVITLFVLMLPMIILFAGVMIPIAMNAKTFKEAQSIITPLNIVFIMLAMVGMMPGITQSIYTACIPVVNVTLGIKSILSGYLEWLPLITTFVVMILISGLSILFSYRKFDDEKNIVL